MKYQRFLGLVTFVAISTSWAHALVQAKETTSNRAAIPASRATEPKWLEKHEAINARVKQGHVDLIFVGDSHIGGWMWSGPKVWKKYYEPRNAANLGIGGDQTQHVLWRLDHGNIDGISPKLAVLEIGANNAHSKQSPEQIAAGIKAIVDKLREKLPHTKILVLGLLPRGATPDDPFRAIHAAANKLVATLADDKTVFYLDIGPRLLAADGTFPKEMLADNLHLSAQGYKVWAETMEPTLAKLMGEKQSPP